MMTAMGRTAERKCTPAPNTETDMKGQYTGKQQIRCTGAGSEAVVVRASHERTI
ncbi:uncharacterized protein HMPREF1541_10431 [Cyphellophora europaea CBS 101466]|uniref:Uncharacterized protein n=1 Tax=Cyphellophora europaea (strain CBS 101466) TaxID=1220924 RepID=W2S7S8_CYPE1|nr:uncharacterized protein HMPREF1541_10431 [Cyphellophora europaea CBS 101466]ETN44761.1 hypothetical protein HMPREF1541_10431 [Cyphellophora europaea CBS 101466]